MPTGNLVDEFDKPFLNEQQDASLDMALVSR